MQCWKMVSQHWPGKKDKFEIYYKKKIIYFVFGCTNIIFAVIIIKSINLITQSDSE